MVNNLIVQGIKIAIEKGASLENAMMSFYNAGYPKEEIEEAARVYQMGDKYQPTPQKPVAPIATRPLPTTAQTIQQNTTPAQNQQIPISQNPMQNTQPQNQYSQTTNANQPLESSQPTPFQQYPITTQPQKTKQKISHYGIENTKSKTKAAIILLIITLVLLIGGLILLFLFKSSIIDFFNSTF